MAMLNNQVTINGPIIEIDGFYRTEEWVDLCMANC